MTQYAIEVHNISKKFRLARERRDSLKERFVRGRGRHDDFWALRDVSFRVEHGESFGLIGHNGSGKSTMLKLLAGIHRPTSGQLAVDGRVSALLELGAGFHGELTGRENIRLNASILGLSSKQINASMDEIIDFAGIGEFIDVPVKVYSSGMFVRLGFSIAVKVQPQILIVDEIIAVGDEEFQRKCMEYLYELRKQGTTIVLVSHGLGTVSDMCERAVWLDHGEMRSIGQARDVIDDYLRDVNKREAATQDEPDEATAEGLRRGSGEIRIEELEVLDPGGRTVPFVVPGQACTFRMHYRSKAEYEEVVFGLAFFHESGVHVAGPNSGYTNGYVVGRGAGTVDFRVERLSLQPGQYAVSTAAVSRGHTFDYIDRGFDLRVRANEPVTEPGVTLFFGDWALQQSASQPTSDRAEKPTAEAVDAHR